MLVKVHSGQGSMVVMAALLLSITGCMGTDSHGRHGIRGTVTLNDSPLEQGSISFQPVDGAATASGDVIEGGKFSIEPEKGLPNGKFLVQINGVPAGTGHTIDLNEMPGEAPAPAAELVPSEWNVNSQEVIEITDDGPFDFTFEIKSSKQT